MSVTLEVREPEVKAPAMPAVAAPILSPIPEGPPIFQDVLLESNGLQKRRRGWSALFSLVLQCLFVSALVIVPLWFTDELPRTQLLTFLVAPPPPPPPPPPAAAQVTKIVKQIQSDLLNGSLRTPTRIPTKIEMIKEEEAPPAVSTGGVVGGVPGGIPGGQAGGVIGSIISSTSLMAPPPPPPPPKRIRVSQGVTSGLLIRKVEPRYPALAQTARVQGEVVLTAIISKAGEVENLTVMSGHPMLVPAAMESVRQWRYRPFLLNGEPVEVETVITVTFQITH